jgi:cytochrome P450
MRPSAPIAPTAVDFRSPAVIADPHPHLHAMREAGCVQWNDSVGAWCVLGWDPVAAGFRDPRLTSDRIRPFRDHARRVGDADAEYLGECIALWMVFNDPPSHARLRGLVNRAFTRAAVDALRPRIDAIVARLLAGIDAGGPFDFVGAFACPLPACVIAEMLGVPEEDVGRLKHWSDDLAQFVLTARAQPGKYATAARSLREMNAYFARLIAHRRRAPGDGIVDALVAAHDGTDLLSAEELVASCVLLLFAGHETTTHFFSSTLYAWLAVGGDWAALRARMSPGFVRALSDEALRWEGPGLSMSRVACEDFAWHGAPVRAGDRVYLFIASGNRDPAVFADPDRFDADRFAADPALSKRLLTFGHGIHLCLGMYLARIEAEVAWPRLAARFARLRRADDAPLEWIDTLVIRGLARLPVVDAG